MSTTPAATSSPGFFAAFLTDIETIGRKIASWFDNFISSPTGQAIDTAAASVLGEAAAAELINEISSSDKKAVAQDVVDIAEEAKSFCSATKQPTASNMLTVFTDLKSDESTTLFSSLASAAAQALATFINTNDANLANGTWQPILSSFLDGMINGAVAFGATAPTASPPTTSTQTTS